MLLSLLMLVLSGDASRSDIASMLILFAALLFVMFVCLPVHESAHALAAYWLGDDTGRLKGRITLNPFAHLTKWGTLMMLFLGFGYARPVPVNIMKFKNRKLGFALTSLAGPVSNLLMSLIAAVIATLIYAFSDKTMVMNVFYIFFFYVAVYNLSLAMFNLIPVPPLDGSRLITLVLPDKYYYKLLRYEKYFILGILAASFVLSRIDFIPSLTEIAVLGISTLESLLLNIFL